MGYCNVNTNGNVCIQNVPVFIKRVTFVLLTGTFYVTK